MSRNRRSKRNSKMKAHERAELQLFQAQERLADLQAQVAEEEIRAKKKPIGAVTIVPWTISGVMAIVAVGGLALQHVHSATELRVQVAEAKEANAQRITLERQNRELSNKLASQTAESDRLRSEKAELKKTIHAERSELAAVRERLSGFASVAEKQQSEISRLNKERRGLERSLVAERRKLEAATQRAADLERVNDLLDAEIHKRRRAAEVAALELDRIQKEIKDSERLLAALDRAESSVERAAKPWPPPGFNANTGIVRTIGPDGIATAGFEGAPRAGYATKLAVLPDGTRYAVQISMDRREHRFAW